MLQERSVRHLLLQIHQTGAHPMATAFSSSRKDAPIPLAWVVLTMRSIPMNAQKGSVVGLIHMASEARATDRTRLSG
jgi:hypothetical protein